MNTIIINEKHYWEGVPEQLVLMCQAARREGFHNHIDFILDYLTKHMDVDSFFTELEAYEAVHFASRAIEYTLFPLEYHFEKDWLVFADDISHILDRYEELLKLTEENCQGCIHTAEYKQKWNIYKTVSLMASENCDGLEKQLERVLEDTKRNVTDMLVSKDPDRYALMDDGDGQYHYVELGTDAIQTINWLAKEFLPYGKSRKLLTLSYEKYCLFLQELELGTSHPEAVHYLRKCAEAHLRRLCWRVMDEIEDDQLELSEDDNEELAAEKAMFEAMLQKSNERYGEASKEADVSDGFEEDDERKDADSYHEKWGGFTKKLRRLMDENPSLPVVIPRQTGTYDGELDCSVAYVYEHKTEQFREKIIVVHNASDSVTEVIPDAYDDLPF